MPNRIMHKLSLLTQALSLAVLVIMICACSPRHKDFGQFADISEKGWAYNDTVSILPQQLDSAVVSRQLVLGVCHDNDYEYRNLVVEVTYTDINRRIHRDTVNMDLADIYGAWQGKGLGPVYQNEVTVNPEAKVADSTRVSLRHVMRVDTLRGVRSVGILLK